MSEGQSEGKVAYPYMSAGQWYGVRAKLRSSLPGSIDVDWLMAALGTSEKGARNVMPQLKAVGLIDSDGRTTSLAHDLRDDTDYKSACEQVLAAVYPETLRTAYDDPNADPVDVARWFMRNAGTGELTARNQAKLYLLLLKGELPTADAPAKKTSKKVTPPAKKAAAPAKGVPAKQTPETLDDPAPHHPLHRTPQSGPALHIDLQIHIGADASDTQIEAIFKSMAKHLYGRD